MTTNPFPPQAYTRETLVKAYQWLQNQNSQIKELATTPDLLISLYVKAKSQGDDFLDRPSLKTFKSELKSLAGMMGEFETHEPAAPPTPPPAAATSLPPPPPPPKAAPASPVASQLPLPLDAKSLFILQEVKTSLNLSSETEALRLLISMGHSRLKGL